MRRTRILLGLTGIVVVAAAGAAGATVRNTGITCQGSAVITDDGKSYPVDANQAEVKVPRKGVATWTGSVSPATHDHSGEVVIELGLVEVTAGDWGPTKNERNLNSRNGTYELPFLLEYLPPGKYKVSGFHQAKEGRCEGELTLDVEGSLVDNPVGLGSLGLTVLSALGLVSAGRAKP